MQRNTPPVSPAIEISTGEPGVVRALEALWKKLLNLGQAHLLENEEFHRGILREPNDTEKKDTTVTEFQCKLLELQLQYIQSILKQTRNSETAQKLDEILHVKKPRNIDVHQDIEASLTAAKERVFFNVNEKGKSDLCSENNCNKHTQTSVINSCLENGSENELCPSDQKRNFSYCRKGRTETLNPSPRAPCLPAEIASKNHAPVSWKSRPRNPRGHYHLKLSDVPFIVGTSTTSHSVVANVQKIISMMKSHNRGLCSSSTLGRISPLPDVNSNKTSDCYRTRSESDLSAYQDVKNILEILTKDLSTLTLKQQSLRQKLENAGNFHQKEHFLEDCNRTARLIDSKTKQISSLQRILQVKTAPVCGHRRHRSLSDCSPQQFYKSNSSSRTKDGGFVKQVSKTEVKHVVCSYSRIPDYNNTVGSDRRKMMQELKEFQFHLQREDICWR